MVMVMVVVTVMVTVMATVMGRIPWRRMDTTGEWGWLPSLLLMLQGML
jgi:hypothetical protein